MAGRSLLVQVRTRLILHVRRKARSPLLGDYAALDKGRSLDFDDLREYQRGDDVKDIDWKSTARTGSVLLKRYVAIRKHHVLLVVDTGRAMTAMARDGSPKSEVAITVAGVLGSVVAGHGDLVGLLAGDGAGRSIAPWRSTSRHLEEVLRAVQQRLATGAARSDLAGLLRIVRDQHQRRAVVAIITDEAGWSEEVAVLLRRLRVQHDLLWFTILDVDLADGTWAGHDVHDVTSGAHLLAEVRGDPSVRAEYRAAVAAADAARRDGLRELGVLSEEVTGLSDGVGAVLRLVDRSRRVPA